MKEIFITGANSFIGMYLIEELLKKNYNITAIVRRNTNNKKIYNIKNIKIIELNLDEIKNLKNVKIDAFFHLSWDGTRGETRNDIKLQESNVENSIDILNKAKELGCKVFFTAGSQAEYGIYTNCVTELDSCNPNTEYGKAKLKFYQYALDFCIQNKIRLIEPRFFSLYGKGDYEKTLIISIIDKMLKDEPVDLTECIQTWNFLNIKDAAIKLVLLLENEKAKGIYNFGSKDTRILKEFVEEIKKIINSKSTLNYGKVSYGKAGIINVNPNIKKLQKDTENFEELSFEEGILQIVKEKKNEKN
ncbi:MAG: NAD(P)-dependent oxidoreductase [Bacilli bacterium]